MFTAPKITNAGQAAYYESLDGQALVFTSMKLGDGTLQGSISSMTDLVNTVVTMDVAVTNHSGNYVDIKGYFSNGGMEDGFYWREIGVFVADPDNPDDRDYDILYAYQNAYDEADFIPSASVETVEKYVSAPMMVGDADNVSALLDESLLLLSRAEAAETYLPITARGAANGVASLGDDGKVPTTQLPAMDYIPTSAKGTAGGVASLGDDGKVPTAQLPTMDYIPTTAKGAASGVAPLDESAKVPSANSYAPGEETNAETPTTQATGDYWRQGQTVAEGKLTKERKRRRNADGSYSNVWTETHVGAVFMADGTTLLEAKLTTMDNAMTAMAAQLSTIYSIPSQSGSLTFTGSAQSPTWNDFSSDKLTIGGTTSGTNVGTYTVTFTPVDGYTWEDGTTDAVSVTWSIGRAEISAVPSQSGTLTYTGSAQSPTWSGFDSDELTLAGVTSATNASTNTATFTPTANYQWADGTTAAKSVTWTIGKAAGSLSINKTTLALSLTATSGTITVTRLGDGAITATSSNTAAATVSVSGTTVTVNNVSQASGSATITIAVAAGTNYLAPTSKTCAVTASFPSTTLSSNTWAQVKEVSDAGLGSSYWDVGDTMPISMTGKVSTGLTLSALSVNAYIIGFNHNSTKEGTNRIHFKIGKIGTVDAALCDSKYGSTVSATGYFSMNSSNTNAGGWASSQMRTNIMGSAGTPASPTANSIMAALPADLRAVMKSVTKYSDNTGGGSDTASYVTATTDYLFLLSEWEIHGARTYANSAEQNYQAQYAYYIAGNSKIHYRHDATTTAVAVFCRSVVASSSNVFCRVGANGSAINLYAYYSYGVAPGFAA